MDICLECIHQVEYKFDMRIFQGNEEGKGSRKEVRHICCKVAYWFV
jgi:hypothetical protein